MKKKIILLMFIILILSGCVPPPTKSLDKNEESKLEIVRIESNKSKIKESKVIDVFKIYDRGIGKFTDEDKQEIDQSFLVFNSTEQQVYKDSLTFLIFRSFYDEVENRIYAVGILYNNTENQIKNFQFDGILNFEKNETKFSTKSTFEFNKLFYPYINPYEGVDIGIGFDAHGFEELLDSNIEYTPEDVQIDLENIEFKITK